MCLSTVSQSSRAIIVSGDVCGSPCDRPAGPFGRNAPGPVELGDRIDAEPAIMRWNPVATRAGRETGIGSVVLSEKAVPDGMGIVARVIADALLIRTVAGVRRRHQPRRPEVEPLIASMLQANELNCLKRYVRLCRPSGSERSVMFG